MESGFKGIGMRNDLARSAGCDWATSSRRAAVDRLRVLLEKVPAGLILVTGEPGSGKTWLVERAIETIGAGPRTVRVALSSSLDEAGFLYLVAQGLGLAAPLAIGPARHAIARTLHEESAEGRGWLLVVEDVDRASETVAEALRALAHGLDGQAEFAGIVLVGSTDTIRFLAERTRRRLGAMVAHHVHLGPLDFDEAVEILAPGLELDAATRARLQRLHRDSRGNARLLRRLHDRVPLVEDRSADIEKPADHRAIASPPAHEADSHLTPRRTPAATTLMASDPTESLLPTRPPIRVEEGLIEVGWEGDDEPDEDEPSQPPSRPVPARHEPTKPISREEPIEDQYAAIQAWTEWSRNREPVAPNRPRAEPEPISQGDDPLAPTEDPDPVDSEPESPPSPRGNHRAEAQHEFPPYSRLFGVPRRP